MELEPAIRKVIAMLPKLPAVPEGRTPGWAALIGLGGPIFVGAYLESWTDGLLLAALLLVVSILLGGPGMMAYAPIGAAWCGWRVAFSDQWARACDAEQARKQQEASNE
jgi:hypothetical protein